jgi:peptidoglycan hydrolase-like protein with peptidoglycan-binding domain
LRDVQTILAFIDLRFAYGCDPGVIDGLWGPRSREALRAFRRRFKDEGGDVPLSGPLSDKDWGAFFDMYDRGLARMLAVEVADLSSKRGALQFLDPPTLACGEAWPVDARNRDNVRSASNRRVEILFFEDTDVPAFQSEVPPGRSLYENELRFRRTYVNVEGDVRPFALKVLLDGEPLANADYELVIEGQSILGNTGGGAMVETNIPRNARNARLLLQGGAIVFRIRLTEGLVDAEEVRGVQRRLQALAYYSGALNGELDEATQRSLRSFQHDRGLTESGEADGATKAELQSMFGS